MYTLKSAICTIFVKNSYFIYIILLLFTFIKIFGLKIGFYIPKGYGAYKKG